MSLTLNWTKPSRAANLLARGVNAGLLTLEEGTYSAAFDPGEVDVPFGFDPDDTLFDEPETLPTTDATPGQPQAKPPESRGETTPDAEPPPQEAAGSTDASAAQATPASAGASSGSPLLETLLDAVAERVEGGRQRAVASANAKQEELGGLVTLEIAALLVAKEHGIDVHDHARTALEGLRAASA